MATVRLNWTLPTKRTSGFPLSPDEIKHTVVEMSADGGANWVGIGQFPNNVLTTDVTELEPGNWFFRGFVVDTNGKASAVKAASVLIPDTSPPEGLGVFTATLV